MKAEPLPPSAMRASRLLSLAALVTSCAVLAGLDLRMSELGPALGGLMSPHAALCGTLLAISTLAVGTAPRGLRAAGQALALLALAVALGPWLSSTLNLLGLVRVLPPAADAAARQFLGNHDMSGAVSLMYAATALALVLTPLRTRFATQLFTWVAALGLLATSTAIIGLLLGSEALASLGLDRVPTPLTSVVSGVLLLATLAQRGDAGWVSALWSPSAAGSSARGIIAWTVLAPLALALLALAGVREAWFGLHFAFALLAAATCCGLTLVVLWNAARVERAQQRAASARDALQLAANRLRLAQSATGIQMWEWLPSSREWISIDGAERLDPSTNEYLEAGLARTLRDGKAEFEFALRRAGTDQFAREERWMLATCWREQRERSKGSEQVIVGITVDITERKLAAIALETSETRLQLAARALPGFVYDWNCASGKMVRTSGIEWMLGYQGAEISPVSRWWEDLVHPDDRELARPARVARAAGPDSDADSISCEYRVRHRDGNYVWIWDHCVLVRDRSGAVTRVVGSVLDITERKEAEARLAASEHRFKAALLATTGIFWTFTREGHAAGEQKSWSSFTGQTTDELQDLGWLEAIHPDDAAATLQAWDQALTTQSDLVTVQRVRRHDGEYRTFSVHAVPVRDEAGDVVEWVGSHTDITEQRDAERRVRDSLRRTELALDAASVGLWDWDLDSGLMTWSHQTGVITGVPVESFSGRAGDFFSLLLPSDVDHAALIRRQAAESDVVTQTELEIRRADGTSRWIQHRVTAIFDGQDRARRPRRIVGTMRDITPRRELEAEREALLAAERAARTELVAAAQAKDEFLATISHELRTPLNAILGWTTLLQRPRVEASTVRDGLKVIERNARAQTQLLGDLLDANQLMSGKLSLTFQPMDLNEAVRATLDSMHVSIAARKVRIEARIASRPVPVMGDSVRLQQVISNLLSNAIKFTPAGGEVTVVTGADGEMAWCEVRDNGEGIAAEFLPHIFEKFRQGEAGGARRFPGLGLGLAITRQLVESHGGAISVHSEGRGTGAMFRIRLPRLRATGISAAELEQHTPPAIDKPLAGLRILAVDDEPDSREYVQRLLAEQGADIVSVSSAAEALEMLGADSGRFNLLLSDIGMPGSTGYDLIETVRKQMKVDARHLPAVALTAFTRREDCAQALDKGFQKHLAKPVQVGRLIGAIRQLTGRQSRSQERTRH